MDTGRTGIETLKRLLARALVAACASAGSWTMAQEAAPIPLEELLRDPQYDQVALSPSGRQLAVTMPIKGHKNLVLLDFEKRNAKVLTGYTAQDVLRFYWVNDKRVILLIGDEVDPLDGPRYAGMFAVDTDGSDAWTLDALGNASILRTAVGGDDVIVSMGGRRVSGSDVYRFDTRSRRRTLLSEDAPDLIRRWVLDAAHQPVFGYAAYKDERALWAKGASGKWEKLLQVDDARGKDTFGLVGASGDGNTVYLSARNGEDRYSIWKFDRATRRFTEKLAGDDLADVFSGLIFRAGELVGVRYDAAGLVTKWMDPALQRMQQGIDAALQGRTNLLYLGRGKSTRHLVYSFADHAGGWYLFDSETSKLEEVGPSRPWIDSRRIEKREFAPYAARDGLRIPAYVTYPADRERRNLPLVVNIHGGPWLRNYHESPWSGGPTAMILASRGYAVLEPEPRGSAGFGLKHLEAGYRQWGLAMQDDITDGVRALIDAGVVDPKRVCLMGGSYGGYATLQGLVREPDLFRCGIAYLAVSDLSLMHSVTWSDFSTEYLEGNFKVWVGDPDKDAEQFARTSPARNAQRFQAPVLLAYGTADRRVPLIHGERMRAALEAQGKKVEWVLYEGERHGWNDRRNRLDFYKRVEKFLAENLGKP